MLKFLTHKLRTHSLNEESVSEKVEERDSGTESDDEAERAESGDSGYPQRPWLMTPYIDPPPNSILEMYNAAHMTTRVVIENTFGRLKNRWRCLHRDRTLHYRPEKCARIIVACCVLHNIALKFNVPDPEDDIAEEQQGDFCTDVIMKWNDVTDINMGGEACACAPGPRRLAAPEPDQLYDHHSSEEELEVINSAPRVGPGGAAGAGAGPASACAGAAESRRRGASSPPPAGAEKRKWPAPTYDPDAEDLAPRHASSDDDDTKVETPVRFRTSPPLEALKPRRAGVCSCAGAPGPASPDGPAAQRPGGPAAQRPGGPAAQRPGGPVATRPRAGSSAPLSPRRRRTPLPPPRRHRPALDFDKMQQLKVAGGGVRSWRAVGGAHGGELSVFCW